MSVEDSEENVAPFRLLVDKGIGNEIIDSTWCPTMDLVALINSKNEVLVQRAGSGSSWTRLLLLSGSSSSPVSCISWRNPDGNYFNGKPLYIIYKLQITN